MSGISTTRGRAAERRCDRSWWVAFACLFGLGSIWALASPLFSVQDEPSHVIRAASVVRGQFSGEEFQRTGGGWSPLLTRVRVPGVFAESGITPPCYAFKPEVPASCASPLTETHPTVDAETTFGRYPPVYYLAVGLPSLVLESASGIYLMRLVSVVLSAALLASAFASARESAKPALPFGVALAVTPMVLFLAGSVNSSSMEVAAAIGFWAALTCLLLTDREATPRQCSRLVVAGGALILARPLSPLWAVLIVAAVVALAEKGQVRRVIRQIPVRRSLALLGAFRMVGVGWIVARDTIGGIATNHADAGHGLVTNMQLSLGKVTDQVLQMIGVFGWADTFSPSFVYMAWLIGVGMLSLLALTSVPLRRALVLVGMAVVSLALPAVLEALSSQSRGFGWFGRYTLPLAVGVPIVAAAMANASLERLGRRLGWMICAMMSVAHILAFVFAMRRYTVGIHFFGPSQWSPPVPALALAGAFASAAVAFMWTLQRRPAVSIAGAPASLLGPVPVRLAASPDHPAEAERQETIDLRPHDGDLRQRAGETSVTASDPHVVNRHRHPRPRCTPAPPKVSWSSSARGRDDQLDVVAPLGPVEKRVSADQGPGLELIDGHVYAIPPPTTRHQVVLERLFDAFSAHLASFGGGAVFASPGPIALSDSDVVLPDLVFVAHADRRVVVDGRVEGPPTLVAEILSDPRTDRVWKRELYARHGVPEYWVVDPEAHRVEVHRLDAGESAIGYRAPEVLVGARSISPVGLPGLVIELSAAAEHAIRRSRQQRPSIPRLESSVGAAATA